MALKTKKIGNTQVSMHLSNCPDDGGKYDLICENHSYLIQDNDKSRLWKFANEVSNWCAACAGEDHRYPNDKWEAK